MDERTPKRSKNERAGKGFTNKKPNQISITYFQKFQDENVIEPVRQI
jgi:hypothetical protein